MMGAVSNHLLFGLKYKGKNIRPSELSPETLGRATRFEIVRSEIGALMQSAESLPTDHWMKQEVAKDKAEVGPVYDALRGVSFKDVLAGAVSEEQIRDIDILIKAGYPEDQKKDPRLPEDEEAKQLFRAANRAMHSAWKRLINAGVSIALLARKGAIPADFAAQMKSYIKEEPDAYFDRMYDNFVKAD